MWELKSDLPNRQLEHLYLKGEIREAVGRADTKRCSILPTLHERRPAAIPVKKSGDICELWNWKRESGNTIEVILVNEAILEIPVKVSVSLYSNIQRGA